jgi:WD40 repeat protein
MPGDSEMTAVILLTFSLGAEPAAITKSIARLGGGVFSHPDHPLALAISPDGSRILSGGADGVLRQWDAKTGKLLHSESKPDGMVTLIVCSSDGKSIFTSFHDGAIRIFDDELKQRRAISYEHNGPPSGIAISKYNNRFVDWRVNGHSYLSLLEDYRSGSAHLPDVSMAAVSLDEKKWALLRGQSIVLTDFPNSQKEQTIPWHVNCGAVTSIAFNHAGTRLLVVNREPNPAVRVIDLAKKAEVALWKTSGPAVFAPDDTVLLREEKRLVRRKPGQAEPVASFDVDPATVAISLDGRMAVADDARARFRVFDLAANREVRPEMTIPRVTNLTAGPNGTVLASTATSGWSWDPKSGRIAPSDVKRIVVPEGQLLPPVTVGKSQATVTADRNLHYHDGMSDRWERLITAGPPVAMAASGDGSFIAVLTPTRLNLYSTATGDRVWWATRKWEDGPYRTVAFSSDGRLVAVGSTGMNGAITVWETATFRIAGRITSQSGSVEAMTFIGHDRVAASTADDSIALWDLASRGLDTPPPTDQELQAAWDSLGRSADGEGYRQIPLLVAGNARTVTLLRTGIERLGKQQDEIRQWVTDLDSSDYDVRQNATKQLSRLGSDAVLALTAATEHASLEVRRRATSVLDGFRRTGETVPITGLVGGNLKLVRAVAVLERIGTPEAKALLGELAKGTGPAAEAAKKAR